MLEVLFGLSFIVLAYCGHGGKNIQFGLCFGHNLPGSIGSIA